MGHGDALSQRNRPIHAGLLLLLDRYFTQQPSLSHPPTYLVTTSQLSHLTSICASLAHVLPSLQTPSAESLLLHRLFPGPPFSHSLTAGASPAHVL